MTSMAKVCGWLNQSYGLNVDVMGGHALDRAIRQRMSISGRSSIADYLMLWDRSPNERDLLLQEVLVGETWFFREPPAFALLSAWLMERRMQWSESSPLRILILPCSTGEEAWSVAATVRDLGFKQVVIEAMDINESSLVIARSARYPLRKVRHGIEADRIGRCLNETIQVDPALQALVTFEKANALDAPFFESRGRYDVVFCRNLLIYMDAPARTRVFALLTDRLYEGGLLFLGHAELPPTDASLRRIKAPGAFAWEYSDQHRTGSRGASPLSRPRSAG